MSRRSVSRAVTDLIAHAGPTWRESYEAINALRPPCPTCRGTEWYVDDFGKGQPCPNCRDGKVSVEQLAATWRALWNFADDQIPGITADEFRAYLRAVRP